MYWIAWINEAHVVFPDSELETKLQTLKECGFLIEVFTDQYDVFDKDSNRLGWIIPADDDQIAEYLVTKSLKGE
jgi:hypothetical protein